MLPFEYNKNNNKPEIIWKYKNFWLVIPLFLMTLQIIMLEGYGGNLSEGWFSDIAYNLNLELNGRMAKDIPYGTSWSSGIGKTFFFIHNVFYKIFGVGVFQARMVTLLSGILLLLFVFIWTYKNISQEIAIFSTFLLATSPLFYISLSDARYEVMLCLFSFLSFYLISSAVLKNRNIYFLFAGFLSAVTVDINYRGIEIVMAVYLFHLIYFEKETFFRRSMLLLTGSFIAFVYWVALNVLPIGINNFFEHVIVPASGDGGHYTIETLFSEAGRFIKNLSGKRIYFTGIEVLYLTCLLIYFCKYRKKYNKISKIVLSWLLVSFIILSLIERTTYPAYLLIYYPLICVFSGIGLYELFEYKKKLAYATVIFIIFFVSVFQGGRFILYSYHTYLKKDFDLNGYYEKLRNSVDSNKSIIGTPNHWYAFPDAQYYGGQFYLSRVTEVLKELKPIEEYKDDYERAGDLLKVFEKREVEYIIADEYFKPTIVKYFPNNKLPLKNFLLVNTITDMFLGKGNESKVPPYRTEIYRIISYDP